MTTVYEVKKEFEKRLTAISNKYGVFYAFSKEQFDKKINRDLIPYSRLGHGGFIPKVNAKKYIEEENSLWSWKKDYLLNTIGKKELIQYELGNHEAQLGGIESTVDALEGYGITREEVQAEYKDFFQKCIDNDWF